MQEWIVAHDGTQGSDAYALECTRCGVVQPCVLPIAVTDWIERMRQFLLVHRDCKARCACSHGGKC